MPYVKLDGKTFGLSRPSASGALLRTRFSLKPDAPLFDHRGRFVSAERIMFLANAESSFFTAPPERKAREVEQVDPLAREAENRARARHAARLRRSPVG